MKNINFIILSNPRSGTNLFFNLLKKNDLVYSEPNPLFDAGFEAFNEEIMRHTNLKSINLTSFINEQFEKNSICFQNYKIRSLKIFPKQIDFFLEKYNSSNKSNLTYLDFFKFFPEDLKIIRIRRKDTVRQAISFYKAFYTKRWVKYKKRRAGIVNFTKDLLNVVPYDHDRIDKYLKLIEVSELKINTIINSLNKKSIVFEYEIFSNNLEETLKKVSVFLNINIQNIKTDVDLLLQRDSNSERLYIKFLKRDL